MERRPVIVIGGGLAGCEAAWQCAQNGLPVVLYEMRPGRGTVAHQTEYFAELVCSNSLRSDEPTSAIGCLKEEMRALGSLIIAAADAARVPAGKALAVDREGFSRYITDRISHHPNIQVIRQEVTSLAEVTSDQRLSAEALASAKPSAEPGLAKAEPATSDAVAIIIATGPLTADPLAREILEMTQTNALYFYDSLAPLVAAETIDTTKTFRAARYGVSIGGGGDGADYVNCPMDRDLYYAFVAELVRAEKVAIHDFEDPKYFEGCLPIEVMAERGPDTLRHGPMKPMGLVDPRTGKMPYAVVQLRQDNAAGTVFNMVGFQSRMKWPEQQRIFRMIPGLEQVEFHRLGAMHRNTYINSPLLLDEYLRLKCPNGNRSTFRVPRSAFCDTTVTQYAGLPAGASAKVGRSTQYDIHFAGQITGVEGYVESAAMGLWVGLCVSTYVRMCVCSNPKDTQHTHIGTYAHTYNIFPPPPTTVLGSLIHHVAHGNPHRFEPNNAHWGLTPPLTGDVPYKERKSSYLRRARADFAVWFGSYSSHKSSLAKFPDPSVKAANVHQPGRSKLCETS